MKPLVPCLIVGCLLSAACANSTTDSGDIGGSTDVPLAQAGNVITTGSVTIGGQTADVAGSMTVLSNDNGVATVHLTANLAASPALAAYNALIPADLKDSSGKLDMTTQFRVTVEGVQDQLNVDKSMQTLVKYSSAVGDTYSLNKSDGKTITRTVTAKSDLDDFPYGLIDIKTMTIEQDSRIAGIKKFVIRANHKFGIVHLQIVADDASTASTYLYSAN